MNALSRREEDVLLKSTKARALKECDEQVKAFAECSSGRLFSVAWACRGKYQDLQQCMLQYTSPESMQVVRSEYIRLRDSKASEATSGS